MIPAVINGLATLTLIGGILIILVILAILSDLIFKTKYITLSAQRLAPNAYHLIFLISLIATLGSLFYSEVAKYTPCVLCWYQRIFMYPQTLIVYLATIRNERVLTPYLLLMNVVGGIIALYHYIIQVSPKLSILPCELAGKVSCTKAFSFHYGYITIPMMALTAFTLNLIILLLSHDRSSVIKTTVKKKRKG